MGDLSYEGKPLRIEGVSNVVPETVQSNLRATFARGYVRFNELMSSQKGAVSIVGSGPSLAHTYKDLKGDVFACNSAHDFLIAKGIVPKFAMYWDANPIIAKFAQKPHKDVTYLIASRCHPDVFNALKGYKVIVFHAMSEEDMEMHLVHLGLMEPMVGGGSAGVTRGVSVAGVMGYTEMHLFGVDSCYEGDETHAGGSVITQRRERVRICGKTWTVAPWMLLQLGDLKMMVPFVRQMGVKLIIHGTGLVPYAATFMGVETPDIKVNFKEKMWRKLEFCRSLIHGFEQQLLAHSSA